MILLTFNKCLMPSTTLASEWNDAGQAPFNSWVHGGEPQAPSRRLVQSCQRKYVTKRLQNSRNKPKRSQIHRTQAPHRYQNIHRHSKKG